MEGQNFTPPPTPGAPVSPQPDPRSIGEILRDSMAKDPEATRAALAAMATPQPEPAGAGVDLEALALFLEDRSMSLNCGLCSDKAEEIRKALRSPASPPRYLEVAKVKGYRDIAEDLLRKAIRIANEPSPKWYKDSDAKIAAIKGLADVWDQEAERLRTRLRAHPPEATPAPGTADWWNPGHRLTETELAGALAVYNDVRRGRRGPDVSTVAALEQVIRDFLARQVGAPGTPIEKAARALVDAATTGSCQSEYSQQINATCSLVPTKLVDALERALSSLPQEGAAIARIQDRLRPTTTEET
jgi:hypothetical protein